MASVLFHFVLLFTISSCFISRLAGEIIPKLHSSSSECIEGPPEIGSALKLVHKYGPCYKHGAMGYLNHTQIAMQDQSRVDWISANLFAASTKDSYDFGGTNNIPARSGIPLGSGNYLVNVLLGERKENLSVVFDTGSGLTWVQCQPCRKTDCYRQTEPLFSPKRSSSYRPVLCNTPVCDDAGKESSTSCGAEKFCVYNITYADGSTSKGFMSTDTLTIGSDVFSSFPFGCGFRNIGRFGTTAGMLGLSPAPISFVSQTASSYGKYFSYCIPSETRFTGYLRFGKTPRRDEWRDIRFTPMVADNEYMVHTMGISINTVNLTFSSPFKTLVDSGTVITRLSFHIYIAVRDHFREEMSRHRYPLAYSPVPIFDTCYNFTGIEINNIPTIIFYFKGNVEVPINLHQRLRTVSPGIMCLAFATHNDPNLIIFGNTQQQTYQIVYDVAGKRVGFRAGGCP